MPCCNNTISSIISRTTNNENSFVSLRLPKIMCGLGHREASKFHELLEWESVLIFIHEILVKLVSILRVKIPISIASLYHSSFRNGGDVEVSLKNLELFYHYK